MKKMEINFVDKTNHDLYHCVLHKDVLNILNDRIVMLLCGHRCCSKCLANFLQNQAVQNIVCPGGLEECGDTYLRGITPQYDRATEKEMKEQEVLCNNTGCSATVRLNDLLHHLDNCPFKGQECKYCGETLPIKHLESHQESCILKNSRCPFHKFGCDFQGDIYTHECKDIGSHLLIIHKLFQKEQDTQLKKCDDKTKNFASLKDLAAGLLKRNKNISSNLTYLSQMIKENKGFVDHLKESGGNVNIGAVYEILKRNEDRIKTVEMTQVRNTPDVMERMEAIVKYGSLCQSSLIHLGLRMDDVANASYNGKLVWRIDNYRFKWQKSKTGTMTSLYSFPFYTDEAGYRMRLRMYPDGDGAGKGTHVSLYLCLMMGRYDAILKWPFSKLVRFTLLNQDDRSKSLSSVILTDPGSISFKRPVMEMNVPSGCPLFITHSMLQSTPGFIKDDMVFIKVEVEDKMVRHA